MQKIISNIKPVFYLWFLFMLCGIAFFMILIIRSIQMYSINGFWATIGWCSLFTVMLFTVLIIIKDVKFISIDIDLNQIRIFSLYCIFGKRYDIKNYKGIILSKEYGSLGAYRTAYLVDNSMYTTIKINGLFYNNFDELIDAINLPEIKRYKFNVAKYLQLLFTGRIKIESKVNNKKKK